MKRAERHHLKQDELLTSLDHSAVWLGAHRKTLVVGGVAVLAALVLGFGAKLYFDTGDRKAEAAFALALNAYHGHVGAGTGETAGGADVHPRFSTGQERQLAALEAMEKVARDFPRRKQGRQARYYAGLCQWGLSRLQDAERNLQEVVRGPRDLQYYLAAEALAGVKSQKGDAAEAIELLRKLVEDSKNPLPKDHLLFRLAEARQKAGQIEEASRDFQRLLDEYPDSPLRSEADSRRQELSPGGSTS